MIGGLAVTARTMARVTDAAPNHQAPKLFTNPVFDENFPDPGVLLVDGIYYAYGTNGPRGNTPVLTSADLVHWEYRGDAFPVLPSWATSGRTWAPEVAEVDGKYVLYFTIRATTSNRQCVGSAVSDSPLGPFVDDGDAPLVCEADEGGSIDASPFRDQDGSLYLYWKNDGNAIGQPTNLYVQRLTPDGRSLTGERITLLTNDPSGWHGNVIEAPQVHVHDGRYYLFYSANGFDGPAYAVGYAILETPLGPAVDAPENPIVATVDGAEGPGHCSVVRWTDGTAWMLYHAWNADHSARTMWLDRVDWVDGKPDVQGPTTRPQPVP